MKWMNNWILVAAALSAGAAQAQILIGQTVGLTGPVAATVKEAVDGARLYIDGVNAVGAFAAKRSNSSHSTTSSTPNSPPPMPTR